MWWQFKISLKSTSLLSCVLFQIQWQPVLSGLVVQFVLGLITIRWSVGRNIFQCIGDRVTIFLGYSNEGARFVYGNDLIDKSIFAFQVSIFCFCTLTLVTFVDSLSLGMLQFRLVIYNNDILKCLSQCACVTSL
jgi:nucleoside permease NupC